MDLAFIPSPSESVWYLGPIPLRAYALSIIAGIVAACWITEARMRSRGAPKWAVLDIAVWAVPFGIIGGRLYHVFTSPDAYFGADGDPWKIIAIWEGGLGVPGAIMLGGVGAWLACRQMKLPLSMLADAAAPGIPVAQAIGRLGNWFNQELYGRPTEVFWAVEIDMENRLTGYGQYATFHPTFLYELLWNLGVALVAWGADRKWKLGAGRAFAIYVALYGVGRFWIEGLRIDPAEAFAGMRLNQWMSVVIIVGAVIYLLRARGTRQVFVLDGERPVTVDWNSEEAEAAGYVNGMLPKGTELSASEPDKNDGTDGDDAENDAAEDDDGGGEATSEESTEAGSPRDDR
ncbi:prolipoprotein diacylglyceryl transferase [Glycomyces tenuis]|uniref:prolipoprotein diacylglyceryl transferase n=1 Tax=Glycomyces tenuis TaxID=58116 RepID=UPI000401046F|nr:prolipoprotein diacylglyceryl transferase [Glycomyces tenuis]